MLEKEEFNCTGCSACYSICPVKAIKMEENNEGFLEPVIDIEKCTKCGLCEKTCPVLNVQYNNSKKPNCYAVMASDEIRKESSSGGVFPILAYEILKRGGYVAGAIWDENANVIHIVSNRKEDIEKMRKSKYLQSDMKNCYKETKSILDNGRYVLFTGTPCQIAGLKSYLRKDYERLYTVELICHGTPSQKVFNKYIEESLVPNEKQIKTDFRDQCNGWSNLVITTETTMHKKSTLAQDDNYMKLFLGSYCFRKSCGECKFNKMPRQADITIGDFWGVWKYNKKLDDKKGTSIVLINNLNGTKLFKSTKKDFKLVKPVPFKKALVGNPNLTRPSSIHPERNKFYDLINKTSFNNAADYTVNGKCDCMILNFWFSVNYGAMLTCYGIYCLAEKLGFKAKVINYTNHRKNYPNSFSEKFANKYLNLTESLKNYDDFIKLNEQCNTFIAGSDQIWSTDITNTHSNNVSSNIYLLDFAKANTRKISFAASFGTDYFQGNEEQKFLFNHYLQQFDAISVREDDGLNILKDLGISSGEQILDGAFMIPKEKLEEMTKNYKTEEKYIAYFALPYFKEFCWCQDVLNAIVQKVNLPIKDFGFDSKKPVEEWLGFIKNAEFIITDSYHATVFAIIFNKPFVQIKNAASQSRFESLFRLLGIENNSIGELDFIDMKQILVKRNWDKINKKVEEEIKRTEKWFINAMSCHIKDKSKYDIQNYLILKQNMDKCNILRDIHYVKDKNKYLIRYYLYKTLRKITFGKMRKYYKTKVKELKEIKRFIKSI